MSLKKTVTAKKETKGSKNKKVVKVSAEKYVDPKNYLYSILILVGGIILTLLIFKWYNVKKDEKLMVSYLISSNTIKSSIDNINSLDLIKQEAPSSYFIYLSYTNDEEVYKFEKSLKNLIDKYKLNDIFYYVDLNKYIKNNEDYLKQIKENLKISNLDNLPAIIYIVDGEVEAILDGVKKTKLKVADFEELLDIYEFEAIK